MTPKFKKEYWIPNQFNKFISLKDIKLENEFVNDDSEDQFKGNIANLQWINRNNTEDISFDKSQIKFRKRNRIMSNIDNNLANKWKKISLIKKKRKSIRKWSISHSEQRYFIISSIFSFSPKIINRFWF